MKKSRFSVSVQSSHLPNLFPPLEDPVHQSLPLVDTWTSQQSTSHRPAGDAAATATPSRPTSLPPAKPPAFQPLRWPWPAASTPTLCAVGWPRAIRPTRRPCNWLAFNPRPRFRYRQPWPHQPPRPALSPCRWPPPAPTFASNCAEVITSSPCIGP